VFYATSADKSSSSVICKRLIREITIGVVPLKPCLSIFQNDLTSRKIRRSRNMIVRCSECHEACLSSNRNAQSKGDIRFKDRYFTRKQKTIRSVSNRNADAAILFESPYFTRKQKTIRSVRNRNAVVATFRAHAQTAR